MTRPYRKRGVLAEMISEAEPGRCICCDAPLMERRAAHRVPPGPPRRLCGSDECTKLYRRLYDAAYGAQVRRAQ